MLQCAGRLAEVPQVLINPSEDALFNLMSSCAKKEDIEVRRAERPSVEMC
jgi:hypothetical protein